VFDTPLPLIVVGSAGSGKTALTLEKLKTIPGQGAYLTRSAFLVENARSLYFANGYQNAAQEVEFLSLRELVETIDVPPGAKRPGPTSRPGTSAGAGPSSCVSRTKSLRRSMASSPAPPRTPPPRRKRLPGTRAPTVDLSG
jgi:hypothetical protein